ncbi:thymidine kinase [Mycoplasma phocoenae]|uniref:Thymidine kinase n=1 Tax=Mycoplasma phocoenae TaxID=754517 RepID=A0A858U6X9_9MOLU|nr:thymidine kinase [Mycoplasma phocoenae]QJG67207.1 thymidine kinase [Mycoplasma phocoenae]
MYRKYSEGIIEVITGPMFSGKSEELLKRIRTLEYANYNIIVIKPSFDTRFSKTKIVSRAGTEHDTHAIDDINSIYSLINEDTDAIIIDEAHFFNDKIIDIVDDLANKGFLVIVSGLDTDYKRRPFRIMADIMSIAERVTKLWAVCVKCKNIASCTYRTSKEDQTLVLDDTNNYEARCRKCHNANK